MKSNNSPGQITYTIDNNSVVWLEAEWSNDSASVEQFATLLYEIHSGELLEGTLRFLKEECVEQGSQKVYQQILVAMDRMFLSNGNASEEADVDDNAKNTPVVSPTEVALNYLSMF